ncbi:unnamed protein product [Mucor hiemalis]
MLLLETSGHFRNNNRSEIGFDHHKGLFGALAMLNTAAYKFPHANMSTLKTFKVFFVHGAVELPTSFSTIRKTIELPS